MAVEYLVHYYEPNNLEHNPEDLNVGVYFEVDVQKRGSLDSGTYKGEASFGFKPVNVFGGEDNLITTSYSDITMLELSNGGNTESIGIESINIKYNSWYFPEVNIKFVDVRGNALFNPMEMTNDSNSNAQGSFLSCLFMFPYPIFKITIKGYYGKPVTFNMTVRDVRASLNPQSGNFEVSVNFIGYMYSYLTDVPMRYLFAAPYIGYDNVSSYLGEFQEGTKDAGIPIPTFTEFIAEMSKGIESMENNSEITKAKETIGKCGSAKNHIENIKTNYNGVKNLIINSCKIYDNNVKVTNVEDFFDKTDISQPFEIEYKGDEETVKNTPLSGLVDGLNSYVNSAKTNWNALKQTDLVYEEKDIQMVLNPTFIEQINNFSNDKNNHFLDNNGEYLRVKFYMNYTSDMKLLENILDIAEDKSSKAKSALEKAEDDVFNNTLSWRPTISNVFQMTLAHLDKFYENVNRCISDIDNSSNSRQLSKLDVETDCNTHGSELTVFPFPAFYDNEDKYLWIGNTKARNYHERYLVEHIINGSQLARDDMKEKLTQYDQNFNATFVYPQKGIPSLLYDVVYGNPYKINNIDFANLVTPGGDYGLPKAAEIFITRYLLKYFYNKDKIIGRVLTSDEAKTNNIDFDGYKNIPFINDDMFVQIEALNLLGEGNNLKAIKDSGFWDAVGNTANNHTEKVYKFAEHLINEVYSKKIEDIESEGFYDAYYIDDKKRKDMYIYSSKTEHRFVNTIQNIPKEEYDAHMAQVSYILGNENIDYELYKKCFPLSIDSMENNFELTVLQSSSGGFLMVNNKEVLNNKNTPEYEDMQKQILAYFENDKGKNVGRIEPEANRYFNLGLNENEVVDFTTFFGYSNSDLPCYNATKESLKTRYTNTKETWIARHLTPNAEKKLCYSFSCRRYPNMGDGNKLGDAPEDVKLQILDDFFKALGFSRFSEEQYNIEGFIGCIVKMENSGIIKVPLLYMVYIGRFISKLSDKKLLRGCYEYSIVKEAIKIYEDNWKNIVDDIVQYILKEQTANDVAGTKNDDYEFYETKKRCYVFRRLSPAAIGKLNELFKKSHYVFNLHGSAKGNIISNDYTEEFKGDLNRAFSNFQIVIADKCGLNLPESNIEDAPLPEDNAISDDRKLGIYDTLKNLYDRWKFGCNRNGKGHGNLETQVSIKNFVFRNALNEDIGDKYNINIDKVVKLISSIYKGNTDMSVYSFLTEVTRIADCMMLSLPANVYEVMNSMGKMKELFTPYRYISAKEDAMQTTYIVTHRQKTSEHLDFAPNVSEYKNDGVTFKNKVCKSVEGDDEELGVFGVTYSLGNQRFFKDIKVSMDKPIVTEQSIAATMQIAEAGGSKGSNTIGRAYHDLFDTYSAHNYNCTVTTMGNAQIMPMMYFQLNNIGLFKGGYMIINVEHTLNNQGMTTTFIGNRISKYQFNLDTNNVWERDGIDNTEYSDNDDKSSSSSSKSEPHVNRKKRKDVDNLAYSKENTTIIIDAGHYMSKAGKESPDLNPETDMFKMDDPERRGDGVLNPYDIYKNETYRYREYWGNRKIANRLVEKLRTAGYTVKDMYESDKAAKDYENFGGKTNSLYNDLKNQGKTMIIVSIHSNAAANSGWGGGNFWSIYCQRDDISDVYNPKTSYTLAECIAKKAKKIFKDPKNADILPVVGDKKMSVKTTPQTFTDEPGKKYRPTTMSHAPAVLSENLFHDTKSHVKFLGSQKGREMIAEIHYQGIVAFFDEMQKS